MAAGILVDTSAWIEALRTDGDPRLRDRVREAILVGTAHLCDIVRLELWAGVRGDAERQMLRDLERDLVTVRTDERVWKCARSLARLCRQRGVTLPATDLLVAACARENDLDLLHRDAHFDRLAALAREDG